MVGIFKFKLSSNLCLSMIQNSNTNGGLKIFKFQIHSRNGSWRVPKKDDNGLAGLREKKYKCDSLVRGEVNVPPSPQQDAGGASSKVAVDNDTSKMTAPDDAVIDDDDGAGHTRCCRRLLLLDCSLAPRASPLSSSFAAATRCCRLLLAPAARLTGAGHWHGCRNHQAPVQNAIASRQETICIRGTVSCSLLASAFLSRYFRTKI